MGLYAVASPAFTRQRGLPPAILIDYIVYLQSADNIWAEMPCLHPATEGSIFICGLCRPNARYCSARSITYSAALIALLIVPALPSLSTPSISSRLVVSYVIKRTIERLFGTYYLLAFQ